MYLIYCHLQKQKLSDRLLHAECEDKIEELKADVNEWKSFCERLQEKEPADHQADDVMNVL